MICTVREYLISEHKSEFSLTLPKDYRVLSVQIREGKGSGHQPHLHVLAPADAPQSEKVEFVQIEGDQEFEGGECDYVGSYQEKGYYRVKHLFRRI